MGAEFRMGWRLFFCLVTALYSLSLRSSVQFVAALQWRVGIVGSMQMRVPSGYGHGNSACRETSSFRFVAEPIGTITQQESKSHLHDDTAEFRMGWSLFFCLVTALYSLSLRSSGEWALSAACRCESRVGTVTGTQHVERRVH